MTEVRVKDLNEGQIKFLLSRKFCLSDVDNLNKKYPDKKNCKICDTGILEFIFDHNSSRIKIVCNSCDDTNIFIPFMPASSKVLEEYSEYLRFPRIFP